MSVHPAIHPTTDAPADAVCCPGCQRTWASRVPRDGFLDHLLAFLGIYPYRCQLCRRRFRRRGRHGDRADRRQHERVPAGIPVTLMWNDGEGGGLLRELSIAGATVETDSRLSVGDSMRLSFKATGLDAEVSVDVSLVRSVRPGEVGVEFTELGSEEQERLTELVADLLERLRRV